MVRKLTAVLLVLLLAFGSVAAHPVKEMTASVTATLPVEEATITAFEKYGHATLDLTIEKILADGYELGDTVDLEFSNGYRFENIPFFDGYYVAKGEPLLRAYPGHETVAACINYGRIYEVAGLSIGDTVKISLNTKGAALETEILNSLHYTASREDYSSDEEYANFREVRGGDIAPGKLYRSCSPVNNKHNRASWADRLIASAGVKSVLNLADTSEEIESYFTEEGFDSPYYKSLYENGNVIALNMSVDFSSSSFQQSLAGGIRKMVDGGYETPVLVHCTEGKDRAGFTCALIEALMGAGYDEIVADYMKSYENYYGVTSSDEERYSVIVKNNIDEMLKTIAGVSSVGGLTPSSLSAGARRYLLGGGMTDAEVDALISALR